ncbi:hypothetical protein OOK41_31700 [Micromonospora sp. NBC_01655]|uniref:hypothetical protein n=1 Tax=Micromonospora sp. NBC_01655 TaxID=2975983 RepID=UPI0022543FE8|nr:hypothetical protein [Micromonospora sp. NBC_01655]MCX4474827.1 hypothetical protein [Micromonospora sp. NBC_01655]
MTPEETVAHGVAILSVAVKGDEDGVRKLLSFEDADTTIKALIAAGVTLAEVAGQRGGQSASSTLAELGLTALGF